MQSTPHGKLFTLLTLHSLNTKNRVIVVDLHFQSSFPICSDSRFGFYFLTQKWTGTINIDKPNPKTGYIEHDKWKWATIDEVKDIANTEIPIYLLSFVIIIYFLEYISQLGSMPPLGLLLKLVFIVLDLIF